MSSFMVTRMGTSQYMIRQANYFVLLCSTNVYPEFMSVSWLSSYCNVLLSCYFQLLMLFNKF